MKKLLLGSWLRFVMDLWLSFERVLFIGNQYIWCRDLKPANILMSKGKIKIGDFGFAKKNANHKLKNQTTVGTPLYMPIELLKG